MAWYISATRSVGLRTTLLSTLLHPLKPSSPKATPIRPISQRPKSTSTSASPTRHAPLRLPPTTWDTHMHVTSPDYPLAATASYKPPSHPLSAALAFESHLGASTFVLVQPSIYGTDNSCLLDALRAAGPQRARGVVGIDPATVSLSTLREWDDLGVRGVRLNLKSTETRLGAEELRDLLRRYAQVVRPVNWVLELFIAMKDLPVLESVVAELGVRVCVAHFGAPELGGLAAGDAAADRGREGGAEDVASSDPYALPGFASLIRMLRSGTTWVKFSAAYRFDSDPEMRRIGVVAREILRQAGEQVVFASDWPHTRFDGHDVGPFVERCLEWSEERGLAESVFSGSAERLFDAGR